MFSQRFAWIVALILLAVGALVYLFTGRPPEVPTSIDPASGAARFVGTAACIDCHRQEYDLWRTSDHARAMDVAAESTVSAPFRGEHFVHRGVTSTFFRRDGRYMVSTEGPTGAMQEFEISYTFGIYPLQQYLIPFPGGKYQTLPLCWDSRPAREGGQRWFHIYGDERIPPQDILFWTRIAQNWNYMCSECHSTDPKKNFDPTTGTYASSWSEIMIACEACHGPGSDHVVWGTAVKAGRKPAPGSRMGLQVLLKDRGRATWAMNDSTGNSARTVPKTSDAQLEICARCHSRRTQLTQEYVHGDPLANTHMPALLDADLYFADGQILDEVYEYGSFKQSRMYQKGVQCVDCHEPHSMRLYERDNTLCYRCHSQRRFGSRDHHFHDPDSTGASCIQCHMPSRTYMQVDARRDHSFRIPRPDLSARLGVPNTCTACHEKKSARWAAEVVAKWYGPRPDSVSHQAVLFAGGRAGDPRAVPGLVTFAGDTANPAILRGTALSILARHEGTLAAKAVQRGLRDPDPLVRIGGVRSIGVFAPGSRLAEARHLLRDRLRAVRIEAAAMLMDLPRQGLRAEDVALLDSALVEYAMVQRFNSDHPSGSLNLGNLAVARGDAAGAEAAYREGIWRESAFLPQYVNLADLYRGQGMDAKGEETLREALRIDPRSGDAHYALGLLYVRQQNTGAGLDHLKRATELRPDAAPFAYAYGIALNSTGSPGGAVRVLEAASKRHPYDREILFALATIERDRGNIRAAVGYAGTLANTWPDNPAFRQLHLQLQQAEQR